MSQKTLLNSLSDLGKVLDAYLQNNFSIKHYELISDALHTASYSNPWFIKPYINMAIKNIALMLQYDKLESWVSEYRFSKKPKCIALIMAGNIPLVGFHDLLSVILSGNKAIIKLSSKDQILLPILKEILVDLNSDFEDLIVFENELMKNFDAVIATGSNNSSRYFEYYFGKYPSIIRRNRNSVAIIHQNDEKEIYKLIGSDILTYFGLGCRSVSKLYFPKGFEIPKFIKELSDFKFIADNFKYFNNYEYNKSIYLINGIPHLDNGFLIFKEDQSLASPVSVVHYEFYNDEYQLLSELKNQESLIQCVVSSKFEGVNIVKPGKSQSPELHEWADNIDVLRFLEDLI